MGTVFNVTTSGAFTSLYSFSGPDGAVPYAGAILASNGYVYGTTSAGGEHGDGVVFRISLLGVFQNLHSFDGTDGKEPMAALIEGTNGNLYGTTYAGGLNKTGTVFKIKGPHTFETIHDFSPFNANYDNTDGTSSVTPLLQVSNGDFYGTTYYGGANGYGTIYKITATGDFKLVHTFRAVDRNGANADGASSQSGLILSSDGYLYGMTIVGGPSHDGTIYRIDRAGYITNIYSFSGSDGIGPIGPLVQDVVGSFFGVTGGGGSTTNGTIFKLDLLH